MPEAIGDPIAPKTDSTPKTRVRRARPRRLSDFHPYDTLPFARTGDAGEARDFWAPRSTGDYVYDCWLGAAYGQAALPFLREPGGHFLLVQVVLAILERGDAERDRGTVVGMMGVIGRALERPAVLSAVAGGRT